MPVGKPITQKQFNDAKKLLDIGGISMRGIGKIIGISDVTVGSIRDAETLEEMRATERAKRNGYSHPLSDMVDAFLHPDQVTQNTDQDTLDANVIYGMLVANLEELKAVKALVVDAFAELTANDIQISDLLKKPDPKKRKLFGR